MPLNNRFVRIFLAAALLLPAAHAGAIFTPIPSTISGNPGDTVGWGFTISNDTNYLLITSADFTPATPLGTFTDFIGQFNFIVVGPSPESTSVSQPFDATALTGVGSFLISPSAAPGSVITGLLTLTYDLFSVSPNDPNFDPDTETISNGNILTSAAEVDVTGVSTVPEPASFGLVGLALLIGGAARKARQRHT
jgi:hypothetical protein